MNSKLTRLLTILALSGMAMLAVFYSAVVPARQDSSPPRIAERVLVVSIDGLRPDVLLRAEAPALRALMARGSFSMWAVTTPAAVTLPSHASMLTGVTPEKHGVVWNNDRSPTERVYPAYPTLFELAGRAGYSTAMVAGKSKFSALAKPGTLDWSVVPPSGSLTDVAVTDTVTALIRDHAPQVLFVHLAGVDLACHDAGWGSAEQLVAITVADRCLARLLSALDARSVGDSTVILVTSDHGGAGRNHGPGDARSRYIPWILAGPGVRPNVDLTLIPDLEVRTEDSFATLVRILGLRAGDDIDGRPVDAAFDRNAPRLRSTE